MHNMNSNIDYVNHKFKKIISTWLIVNIILILSMIALGGYTRLTDSGLSISYWKPVSGIFPPASELEWVKEFESYKSTPEYQKINYGISIEKFKSIFWVEFLHRILGRIIGLVFLLPLIFFSYKKYISLKCFRHLSVIFALILFQGFIGWYMVKSGLVDNPHVSHFRLAIHLVTACIIFIMNIFVWYNINYISKSSSKDSKKFLYFLLILNFIQIIYGAFVAGLDGGLIYNSFPLMDGKLIPQLGNIFTDITTIQFIHRYLAKIIFVMSLGYILCSKKISKLFYIYFALLVLQLVLGIITLVNSVPIIPAIVHQINAVVLLSILSLALYKPKQY